MDKTELMFKELTEASGISGFEDEVADLMASYVKDVASVTYDNLGSLVAKKKGKSVKGKTAKKDKAKKTAKKLFRRECAEAYAAANDIEIDKEVKRLIMDGYNKARSILEENSEALVRLAETLLEREVLDSEQIAAIVRGETLPALVIPEDEDPEPQEASDTSPEASKAPGVLPEPGNQPA